MLVVKCINCFSYLRRRDGRTEGWKRDGMDGGRERGREGRKERMQKDRRKDTAKTGRSDELHWVKSLHI